MSRSGVLCVMSLFVGGLVSCGGNASPAGGFDPAMPPTGEPLLALSTQGGTLTVSVWTAPQPPRKGSVDVLFRILDQVAAPVDGLTVRLLPWMPAHGHGTSAAPVVTPLGDGRYLATPVYLYMSGRWELRTTMEGPASDSVVPVVDIP